MLVGDREVGEERVAAEWREESLWTEGASLRSARRYAHAFPLAAFETQPRHGDGECNGEKRAVQRVSWERSSSDETRKPHFSPWIFLSIVSLSLSELYGWVRCKPFSCSISFGY